MSDNNIMSPMVSMGKVFKAKLVEIACQFDNQLDENPDTYTGIITKSKIVLVNNDDTVCEYVYILHNNSWIIQTTNTSGSIPGTAGGMISGYCQSLFSNSNVVLT